MPPPPPPFFIPREILVEESNVQRVDSPVTVSLGAQGRGLGVGT